jgi:hypothetical protein
MLAASRPSDPVSVGTSLAVSVVTPAGVARAEERRGGWPIPQKKAK